GLLGGEVERDHVGAAALHLEAEETAGGADLQHAPAAQFDAAEVSVHAGAQIPFAGDAAVVRHVHRVVEVAVGEVGDRPWRGVGLVHASAPIPVGNALRGVPG